jgi:hypothetical protein
MRCGPSFLSRSFSLAGDPMVKLPAGTTTISGQLSHSLKLSFGFSPRSAATDSGAAHRDASETAMGAAPHIADDERHALVRMARDGAQHHH